MKRRSNSQVDFDHLSINEKLFKKGHHYITVFSHPDSGPVLDIEEDRTKEACKKLSNKSLIIDQLEKVGSITMDMWKTYMLSAKEFLSNASIVHDRFHLIKYINEGIDKIRRREVKHHQELKNSRCQLWGKQILAGSRKFQGSVQDRKLYAWSLFKNHITGVVNALISNLTDAMAERLNGKIQ